MEEELLWGVKNGDLSVVQNAVNNKKDLLNTTISGRKLIHFAADYGQTEMIEFLIEKGADVNALDSHGISPLLAAIYEGHLKCVSVLLQKGANKNLKAPDGSSFVDCAESEEIRNLLK